MKKGIKIVPSLKQTPIPKNNIICINLSAPIVKKTQEVTADEHG